MRSRASSYADFILGALSSLIATTVVHGAAAEIHGYRRREMTARSIPGLAWAAVDGDAIVGEGSLGLASIEVAAPVEARSVFPIASLDKQITAAGVMVLVQRGKLSLDDP